MSSRRPVRPFQMVAAVETCIGTVASIVALISAPRQLFVLAVVGVISGLLLTYLAWWLMPRLPSPLRQRQKLQALADVLEATLMDRVRYENAVRLLVDGALPCPMREQRKIVFVIGQTPEQDSALQKWETQPDDPDKPIRWHYVEATAWGDGVPRNDSIRQLDVEAFETVGGQERRLQPLPVGAWGGRLWGVVFFNPEIAFGFPRKWRIRYRWPGAWNNLRTQLQSECSVSLTEAHDVTWELLEVEFVFPPSARVRDITAPDLMSPPDLDIDDQGRRHVTYRLYSPPSLVYTWRITLDEFAHPGQRLPNVSRQVAYHQSDQIGDAWQQPPRRTSNPHPSSSFQPPPPPPLPIAQSA